MSRRGFAVVYTAVMLIALCALVSLGVDLGRVQLAKSELQSAADAAVRAAAAGFFTSASQARIDAVDVAGANLCDGEAVVLDPLADVEFGTWDAESRTFTPLAGADEDSAGAIRVTARRISARNSAIPLMFARVIGLNSINVQASAIATMSTGSAGPGFAGIEGVELMNNAKVASYRSSNGPPKSGGVWNNGSIGSNATVRVKNNAMVKGDVIVGPDGRFLSGQNTTVTGRTNQLSSPLEYPPVDPGDAATVNDNGRIGKSSKKRSPLSGRNFTLEKESISIGPGTYYFTCFKLGNNAKLTFTGPVVVYVDGPIDVDKAEIITADNNPANLRILQIGSGGIKLFNKVTLTAEILAPESDLQMRNNVTINGSAVCRRIVGDNNVELYFDELLETAGGSGSRRISLVK